MQVPCGLSDSNNFSEYVAGSFCRSVCKSNIRTGQTEHYCAMPLQASLEMHDTALQLVML